MKKRFHRTFRSLLLDQPPRRGAVAVLQRHLLPEARALQRWGMAGNSFYPGQTDGPVVTSGPSPMRPDDKVLES